MQKQDVIDHFEEQLGRRFGVQRHVAKLLNISEQAVGQWPDVVPEKMAYRLQRKTAGALQVNESVYEDK